ncbi:NIPSNAP family protein [Tellurirhabdus rosea]|uniref:NIPSNAP family protein n=1 Tax=Tellurirhabdus rosea TaxID=2674997 RepID=UPI002250EE9E|nr:NIPSNAP family protein [Tellurirhabdus rosea]
MSVFLKNFFLAVCLLLAVTVNAAPKPSYYELRTFRLKTPEQEKRLDAYLEKAFIPALHRAGVAKVGVFKPVETAAGAEQIVYVFIPYKKTDEFFKLPESLSKDKAYNEAAQDYLNAAHNDPVYTRFESALMESFSGMPSFRAPSLKSAPAERIYELRNYEAATEKLHQAKVHQFNNGEMQIFERLGFNAIFYGRVLAGNKLPSLMYMTSFENKTERDAHWKTFSADPEWKKLNALPEYKNNFLRADILLLHPAAYSEI